MTKLISLARKSNEEYQTAIQQNAELIKACESREELRELLSSGSKETIRQSASRAIKDIRGNCPMWSISGESKADVLDWYMKKVLEAKEQTSTTGPAKLRKEKTAMTKFEVGKMYQGVIERTGAVRYFEVVRRTPKFITIRGEMVCGTEKIRVKESDGIETAQYDCAWLHYQLRADKGILDEETSNEAKTPMTQTTEQTLECFKTEIETCKTRPEAESFLNGLTVKELKALYKYSVTYTYGEWYRMRKAEFIEEILDYYFEPEVEESESEEKATAGTFEELAYDAMREYYEDENLSESEMKSMFENRESDKQSGMNMPELPEADSEVIEALKPAENESKNEVQRVMAAITAVNYEPEATREILKMQTHYFQQAMLQIMDGGHGSIFDEDLRISDLLLCVKGIKDPETRQRYIENADMCIKLGMKNIEFFRNHERFQEYIPMHEEWQKYYQDWQEYLESYEGKKEISA